MSRRRIDLPVRLPLCLLLWALTLAGSAQAMRRSEGPTTALATGAQVGTLETHVPAKNRFVLRGTMPIRPRPFQRDACPFVVLDPDGTALVTQWELVARMADTMIVEILAIVEDNRWSGVETFRVVEGQTPFDLARFDKALFRSLADPRSLELVLLDSFNDVVRLPISGRNGKPRFHRYGPAAITVEKSFSTAFGGLHAWFTIEAGEPEIEVVLNWHAGGLPARPDVTFRALALSTIPGTTWTPLLPDPAMNPPLLVRRDAHVLPQRMERSFRVVVHPIGRTPDLSRRGWGVGDWSRGGYFPQSIALPSLDHTSVDLAGPMMEDFVRLKRLLPTQPGDPPVSALWPAHGIYYGGMTGGIDIEQFAFADLAITGQPEGLLSAYVEQLRYASRHRGCIYEPDGSPIVQDRYLNPDGSAPWSLFNNEFQGNPVQDQPFGFSLAGPPAAPAAYDPRDFSPIDTQHLIRRTKANKALVWLDNDPLAKLYVTMDAELGRMSHYEGPGGRLQLPATPGLGTAMGRGEAWVADVMAAAWAINGPAWRSRNRAWFQRYVDVLRAAQMPSGLFSAVDTSKLATSPPYGNGQVAYYWAHRSNEQIQLMHALTGIQSTVGIDTTDLVRRAGEGLWKLAWKPGADGPLERYPAGPVSGPRYTTRAEIPAGLTDTVAPDSYHIATALGAAWKAGANMVPALLAHTGAKDLYGAYLVFQGWGADNIANRANTLALLQGFFGQ